MNQPKPTDPTPPSRRLRYSLVGLVVLAVGLFTAVRWQSGPTASELVLQAKKSLRMSRFDEALNQVEAAIRLGDDTPANRLVAGEAALRLKKYSVALGHFDSVKDDAGQEGLAARLSSASTLTHLHRVSESESQLRRVLAVDAEHDLAHRLLAECLGLQGRRWESASHLRHGIRRGDITLQSLCYLADLDRTVDLSKEQLTTFLESDSPKSWLGAACVAISYREFDKAKSLIRKSIAESPELVEAHARLGKLLLSEDDHSVMETWEADLPQEANQFPDIWFIRSQWCLSLIHI